MTVDLVVLGTGSGAQSVAYPCREAGWSVTVIDNRPFGGTCQLRGCDPKKVLVGVSEAADWAGRMRGKGVPGSPGVVDWSEMMAFKRTFVDGVAESNEAAFERAGIGTVHGRARFTAPTTLEVGSEVHQARHVVIATGARHAPLGIPGEEHLVTSTGFLDLPALPQRVLFVGGGYIALEFAHVAARSGSEVRVVHRGTRPLEAFDPDLVEQLLETTRELGVEVVLQTTVTGVERRGDEFVVATRTGDGTGEFVADLVVHAAGRVPEIDELDLDAAGIARVEHGGVEVNQYLQSVTNPAVYAAGDAAASGGFPLTPVAAMQGGIVAANLLEGNSRTPNYDGIPSVVYTTPALARVGLDEATAQARGIDYVVAHDDTTGWYSSRRVALAHTGFKTLVEEGTGRILGAHLFGHHAEEVINIFGLAIRKGLTADDLKDMIYAYPTSSSDIGYML
jgi:glutathione reductase (NADPH)